MSMCTEKMTDQESRCGRARSDEEICYQLRGKFGKSRDEDVDEDVVRCLAHRWVQLAELVENIDEAGRKGTRTVHLTTSQNAFTNRPARPLLQKFFRCAGQDCNALRRMISSWGRRAEKGCR